MTNNFLPTFSPPINSENKIKCLIRNDYFEDNPEERIRQRILHWLIETIEWPKANIEVEKQVEQQNGKRPDITLQKSVDETVLVVECKSEEVGIGDSACEQAISYAEILDSSNIWITDGENHIYLENSNEVNISEIPSKIRKLRDE